MSRIEMVLLRDLLELFPEMILLSLETNQVNKEEYSALDIASRASETNKILLILKNLNLSSNKHI